MLARRLPDCHSPRSEAETLPDPDWQVAERYLTAPDTAGLLSCRSWTLSRCLQAATGWCNSAASEADYAAVAYNATTGAHLRAGLYNGPANGHDLAYSLAVRPAAGTVFVTGTSAGADSGSDYATIAYRG